MISSDWIYKISINVIANRYIIKPMFLSNTCQQMAFWWASEQRPFIPEPCWLQRSSIFALYTEDELSNYTMSLQKSLKTRMLRNGVNPDDIEWSHRLVTIHGKGNWHAKMLHYVLFLAFPGKASFWCTNHCCNAWSSHYSWVTIDLYAPNFRYLWKQLCKYCYTECLPFFVDLDRLIKTALNT